MATITIPGKICKHCGGERWAEAHCSSKGIYYICAKCKSEYIKKWYKAHPETMKKYHRSQKGKDALNRARTKERNTLTDNYLRNQLYLKSYFKGVYIVRKDITKEELEAYRKVLMEKRNKRINDSKETNSKKEENSR